MAVVIATHKMTIRTDGGEHTIFPSPDRQYLPDHLLMHDHVQKSIKSKWITVIPIAEPEAVAIETEPALAPRKKKVS